MLKNVDMNSKATINTPPKQKDGKIKEKLLSDAVKPSLQTGFPLQRANLSK